MKQRIQKLLDEQEFNENLIEQLIDILTPEEQWPDLEVVLTIADHPEVYSRLVDRELPERFQNAIAESLQAVLPLLGAQAHGPTYSHVDKAKRRLNREKEKHDIVKDRVTEAEKRKEAVSLIKRYLDTDPAPLFASKLRARFRDVFEQVERQCDQGPPSGRWAEENPGVVKRLKKVDQYDPEDISRAVSKFTRLYDIRLPVLKGALSSEDPEEKLLAAAAAYLLEKDRLGPFILRTVLEDPDTAPQLAVFGAMLTPGVAMNMFAQFLADAKLTDPEKPEAEAFLGKSRALLAARSVLPHINSPLEPIPDEVLQERVSEESLRDIPGTIEKYWTVYQKLEFTDDF